MSGEAPSCGRAQDITLITQTIVNLKHAASKKPVSGGWLKLVSF